MRFIKMQATGNDFVCLNGLEQTFPELSLLAAKLCDRHYGIGGDGVLLIGTSDRADFSMRMWNPDGTEAQMCGNGIRCLGKFVYDRGYIRRKHFSVETKAGVRRLSVQEEPDCMAGQISVEMGAPEWKKLPLRQEKFRELGSMLKKKPGEDLFALSFGNPHCVVFLEPGEALSQEAGRLIEAHEAFPERTNAEFVTVASRGRLYASVWERGAGRTLACGTGACACAAAAIYSGRTDHRVTVELPGGSVQVEQSPEDNRFYLKGNAVFVCEGVTL